MQDHGLEFGEHNTVTGNRITYGSYSGILLGRQRHAIVSNNQILRPGESGIKTYQGSIAKVSRRCYAVSVIGNVVVRPLFDSIDLTSDYGPRVERDKDYGLDEYEWGYLPRHLVVVGNIVKGSDIISDGVGALMIGNQVLDSHYGGITLPLGMLGSFIGNGIHNANSLHDPKGKHGIAVPNSTIVGNVITWDNATAPSSAVWSPGSLVAENIAVANEGVPALVSDRTGSNVVRSGGNRSQTLSTVSNASVGLCDGRCGNRSELCLVPRTTDVGTPGSANWPGKAGNCCGRVEEGRFVCA